MSSHEALIDLIGEQLPRRVGRLSRLLLREAGSPLPRGMAGMLAALESGPLSIGDLARSESLAQPTVTRIVERLETQGLASRNRDPSNRRIVLVSLTDAGVSALSELRDRYATLLRDRLSHLDDQTLQELAHAVEALATLTTALDPDPLLPSAPVPAGVAQSVRAAES
jgi:DNA-binding MarR family transcriptional regulator